ncbi:hypothetical protein EJ110_NYTH58268, partial [Nymphaea thermarum]
KGREVIAILKLLTHTARNYPGVFHNGKPSHTLPIIGRILPFFVEPAFRYVSVVAASAVLLDCSHYVSPSSLKHVASQVFAALIPCLERYKENPSLHLDKVVNIFEELVVENKILLAHNIRELPLLPSIPMLAKVNKVIEEARGSMSLRDHLRHAVDGLNHESLNVRYLVACELSKFLSAKGKDVIDLILGEFVGAVDPAKFKTASCPRFKIECSDDDLILELIHEHLTRVFRAASDTIVQDSAALAIQELLKLAGCQASLDGSDLSSTSQHSKGRESLENSETDVKANGSRANIFGACRGIVRHDMETAFYLLPYLVLNALCHGTAEACQGITEEILIYYLFSMLQHQRAVGQQFVELLEDSVNGLDEPDGLFGLANLRTANRTGAAASSSIANFSLLPPNLPSISSTQPSKESEDAAKTILLYTRWIHYTGQKQKEDVISLYSRVRELQLKWEKGYFFMAKYCDDLLVDAKKRQEENQEALKDGHSGSRIMVSSSGGGILHSKTDEKPWWSYLPDVLLFYAKGLHRGHKHLFQALPRLLTLQFEFGSKYHREGLSSNKKVKNVHGRV